MGGAECFALPASADKSAGVRRTKADYGAGARSFSFSNQFTMMPILRGSLAGDSPVVAPGGFIMRNLLLSGLISQLLITDALAKEA
jgi:hypothetical protein